MNVSTIDSPPLTPPAAAGALVQAQKVEQNAKNGLAAASNDVVPSISAVAQSGNPGVAVLPPPVTAQLHFSTQSQIAPPAKG
jgi:hypothetical protein